MLQWLPDRGLLNEIIAKQNALSTSRQKEKISLGMEMTKPQTIGVWIQCGRDGHCRKWGLGACPGCWGLAGGGGRGGSRRQLPVHLSCWFLEEA